MPSSRLARLALLALPLVMAAAQPASATPVYSQPGTQACSPSCWTSHYGAGSGFRAFDNFSLSSGATITSVSWQGIYIPQSSGETAPSPDTTSWTIGFFSNGSNFPATQLYSTTLAAASVTTTQIGSGFFGSVPVNLYSFTAALPGGFAAAAGTTYWFSPLSNAPSFDPFFSWSPSILAYDNLTTQTDTGGGTYIRPDDRAFTLSSAVPEPAGWALMLAGFGVIGGLARTRRRGLAIASA